MVFKVPSNPNHSVVLYSICAMRGFRKLMCHGKRKEEEAEKVRKSYSLKEPLNRTFCSSCSSSVTKYKSWNLKQSFVSYSFFCRCHHSYRGMLS